jgi:subtilisin-like proprotein convertase family protein
MRSETSEVGTNDPRPRTQGDSRASASAVRNRKLRLRKLAIESLEERALMAVLPPVAVVGTLATIVQGSPGNNTNNSSPTIVIDPTNSQKLAAVWQVDNNQTYSQFTEAATSTDGGQTWRTFYFSNAHIDPTKTDGSILPMTSDPSIAFDRNEQIYILDRSHNADSSVGFLDLHKYDFSGNTASPSVARKTITSWIGPAEKILDPTLAVDANVPTFTDTTDPTAGNPAGVSHTVTDPFVNNVYVAWVTAPSGVAGVSGDVQPKNIAIPSPNRVIMIGSSDGAQTFSPWQTVDDRQTFAKNATPKLVVSQGTFDSSTAPRVAPGQVSIVWDDFGTGTATGANTDILRSDSGAGVASQTFNATTGPVNDGNADGTTATTDFPINVNITNPNFTTLSNLSITLQLTHPNLDQISIQLVPPTGSGLPTTTLAQFLPAGANLSGTTFDENAILSINDGNAAAPYNGHYRPTGGALASRYAGATLAQINGTWTLRITDNTNSNGPVQSLNQASLDIASGLATGSDRTIATTFVRGNLAGSGVPVYGATSVATPNGIGPGLEIAADNTLGVFSPFQGRLYVAYVDNRGLNIGSPVDNTNVMLAVSDNGGLTWVNQGQVNDDDGYTDGFSEGGTSITGRPQFMPSVAVDQTTGTLVYTYRDARNDAGRARVATYITTSIDGGSTFATSDYLNPSNTATDAITGATVNNGPVPDNQSAGNPVRDATYGLGTHDSVAVSGGVIYASWGSNILFSGGVAFTGGRDGQARENIALGIGHIATGPRIISSTMGPVGLISPSGVPDQVNTLRTADGTPIANAFLITFDRPVDKSTFNVNDVQVFFRDTTPGNVSGGPVPVTNVQAQNYGPFGPAGAMGATTFLVNFAPRSAVGTYSYTVGPNISDRIRVVKSVLQATGVAQTFTPAANQVGLPVPPSGTGGTGNPALDTTVSQDVVNTGNPADLVANVTVHVNITHQFPGDLTLTLVSPTGTRIVLVPQVFGGFPSNAFANTTFDDSAANSITNSTSPFNGSFRPANPLSVLNGQLANGTWTLEVNDGGNTATGTLNSWSLQITPGKLVTSSSTGNLMDQNANATAGQTTGDVYAVPTPLNGSATVGQAPQGPFDSQTLPLIIAGPSVIASNVPGNPQTGDNLVMNNTVSAIDLTFDRDMDMSTFTAADVLKVQGPAGVVPGPYTVAAAYNSTNVSIPIHGTSTTTSTLTVPNTGAPFTIKDLQVQLNISAAQAADLTLTLIAPDGTRVPLASGVGGTSGKNFDDTVFSDNAALPITGGAAPFNGTFRPSNSLDAALAGKDLAANGGVWKLEIVNAGAHVGTLNSWSLAVTPNGVAYARTFRIGFSQQQLSGTYLVGLGSNILSRNGDAIDTNHNAGVNLTLGTVSPGGTTTTLTYNSTNVPQSIIDLKTIDSTIAINDSYLIAGTTLTLSINHPSDPDLEATLIAPDGTRIKLFTNVGAGVNPANFQTTTFSDSATTPIQNGGAPFFGTYNPQQPLSQLNGTNVNGTWTLEIKDDVANTLAGTLVSWKLVFQKPVNSSGLGEAVADQISSSFRIFTMDPTNALASSTWTAVGPAANNNQGDTGVIGGMAVDPSDPSGNTVYIGGANGGIWKTTDFLTTDLNGPTYIPLTDFGPSFGLNIGSIAIFGRNSDPAQSIIFATTGFGDVNSPGAGILRSTDGGATWQLLDSLNNVDANGTLLPFSQRTHDFVNKTSFKILVDPTPSPTGGVIVYAAFGGAGGGVYRSLDSGDTWQLMRAGDATDIVLDMTSGTGAPGGNLQIIYAAFRGDGVYISPNRGQVWNLMTGGIGNPLIRDADVVPPPAVPVNNDGSSPNGAQGRIVLARPAPTGNALEDVQYQGWLYALVANSNILYVTKDFGQNWTPVRLPANATVLPNVPSNNPTLGNVNLGTNDQSLSLAIDPTNPNIVYVGGTQITRVDTTLLKDAHAFVAFDNGNPDGGLDTISTTGGIALKDPLNRGIPTPFYNLIRDPNNPFLVNSTILVNNVASFTNDGTDATWTPFTIGSRTFNQHRIMTFVDPLTGKSRIVVGDDQGVYTAVDNNGVLDTGIGTAKLPSASRNGNLQITQFYYGAAQPSNLAAQVANALFYAQSQDNNGTPVSDPLILTNGDLNWTGRDSTTGDGSGVATDQTGSGTSYRYDWPATLGVPSNFFQVDLPADGNAIGRTTGLLQSTTGGNFTGDAQWPNAGTSNTVGNFVVNPLNGNQILISSSIGRIFSTENQGGFWSQIGDLGSYAKALAYGAPDPSAPGGIGNLDSFLYAGTISGQIFVTRTGGGGTGNSWTNISAGLDGSAVQSIVTNPTRGSHEAYAVTANGVFHMVDSTAPNATWQNITGTGAGNLFTITHQIFGDAAQTTTLLQSLTALVVDWRYVIPNNPSDPTAGTHPVLYVAGGGGVFRSIDNGTSWTKFPDIALNNAPSTPGDGGGIPVVNVTDLDLAIGNVDPTTGRANVAGSPNVLLATTAGRGAFAIRLSPIIFNEGAEAPHLSNTLPAPNGSDSGTSNTDAVTNVINPVIQGFSAQTAFGQVVTIKLYDLTDPLNPVLIGTTTTDAQGNFNVQVGVDGANVGGIDLNHFKADSSTDGLKTLGVQAVDQAGTQGNMVTLQFTLDTLAPVASGAPDLEAASDSPAVGDPGYVAGVTDTDNLTFFNGGTAGTTPSFDIQSVEPATTTIFLLRDGVVVNQASGPGTAGVVTITDPGPIPDGDHIYTATQTDGAGNVSPVSGSLKVTIDSVAPTTPPKPSLLLADDTGTQGDNTTSVTRPHLTGTAEPLSTILLYDSSDNLIGQAKVAANGTYSVQPTLPLQAGTNSLYVRAEDVAGNRSAASQAITLTILTATPPTPVLALVVTDDSGIAGDNITNVTKPRLIGSVVPSTGLKVVLVDAAGNPISNPVIPAADGTFIIQLLARNADTGLFTDPLADGTYPIRAEAYDVAGNASFSSTLNLTIDTHGPTTPVTLFLNPADDTGARGDNTTSLRRPRLSGVTEPNASIDLISVTPDGSGGFTNPIVRASGTADRLGNYSIQLPFDLNDGSIYLQASVRDAAGNTGTAPSSVLKLTVNTAPGDFNVDGKADLAMYRPSQSLWIVYPSTVVSSGAANNQAMAFSGDFDGDGKNDIVTVNPATDIWTVQRSTLGTLTLSDGQGGLDLPVVGDFNGDGITDIAAYRPTTGQWFIKFTGVSGANSVIVTDPVSNPTPAIPIPADYNGDGITDLATWATSTAIWTVNNIVVTNPNSLNPTYSAGPAVETAIGAPNLDVPVPADYDGDGKTDLAIYRPTIGLWAIRYSSGGALVTTPTNQSGDIPAPADYDGDGKADRAVYRQGTSQWIIPNTGGGQTVRAVGSGGYDLPVLAPYSYRMAKVASTTVSSGVRVASASFDMGSQAASFSSSSTPAPAVSSTTSSTPTTSAISTPVSSDATPTTSTPPAQSGGENLTPAQQHRQHALEMAAARRARRASILRGLAAKFHKA